MKVHVINRVCAEEVQQITMTAKRWFQKSYGNTYHSVSIGALVPVSVAERLGVEYNPRCRDVWIDLCYIPMTYGYGDQFVYTAQRGFLQCLEDVPASIKDETRLDTACKTLGICFIDNVYDVTRKREL